MTIEAEKLLQDFSPISPQDSTPISIWHSIPICFWESSTIQLLDSTTLHLQDSTRIQFQDSTPIRLQDSYISSTESYQNLSEACLRNPLEKIDLMPYIIKKLLDWLSWTIFDLYLQVPR